MNCISSEHKQSVKSSLEEGTLVVIEADDQALPRFEKEEKEKNHVARLKHWEKKLYDTAWKDYLKFSQATRQSISTARRVMCVICHVSARNCLEGKDEYQEIAKNKRHNTITLYKLIGKICNGSTLVVQEDMLENLVELLCNFVLLKDNYNSLWKHVEVLE